MANYDMKVPHINYLYTEWPFVCLAIIKNTLHLCASPSDWKYFFFVFLVRIHANRTIPFILRIQFSNNDMFFDKNMHFLSNCIKLFHVLASISTAIFFFSWPKIYFNLFVKIHSKSEMPLKNMVFVSVSERLTKENHQQF